ncbi:PAS domain-containing protein [Chitinilyticum litopenaei]|uniref:PAS domain-containing protein n=2 Tax=Chitinilyticum piscinae TaxID=2866724 RepID=A0A8J7FJP1_9NEIS|nr:PAS domain-containing protein [Chitinilyticum piscinae]
MGDQDALKDIAQIRAKSADYVKSQDLYRQHLERGDLVAARGLILGELRNKYNAFRDEILAASEQEKTGALAAAGDIDSQASVSIKLVIGLGVTGIAIALALFYSLVKRVRKDLGGEFEQIQQLVTKLDAGDYSVSLTLRSGDTGSLLARLLELQHRLADADLLAKENARVRTALDAVSTSVMIADAGRNIIYINPAQQQLLSEAEADLRAVLPQFDSRRIIGVNIDSFHKNPAHQRGMLERLTGKHATKLTIGRRHFALTINPILDAQRKIDGFAVEWVDQTELVAQQERERKASDEMSRIMGALETTSTNVMIADADRNIIYMNRSVRDMLTEAQADLRKALPHFDVSKVVGSNMDIFHRNPAHQAGLLGGLTSTYRAQIVVAGRTFRLIANPIFNQQGQRLGSVVEWLDRTAEVAVEKEVAEIVTAAAEGDYSRRIGLNGKEGFFKSLGENLNLLMQTNQESISEVATVLSELAQGNLTKRVTGNYHGLLGELKDDCNLTIERLGEIVMQIKEAATTINGAAQEIAAGNSNLSSRTEQQAASLEETASSMEELTSTVRQNAENAKQANQLAIGASDIAVRGGNVVGEVVSTMAEINDSAKKIVDIITVIDGIAFQTNILALNAAVEAARAGEQGRGFAVVASEVRSLAQRSAGAAKEIKALIGDSVIKVESGSKLVDEAGQTIKEVVGAVRRVTDIMSEISAASSEQSAGIEQVNQAVTNMDENTQQNAALVEEAAAAAESLEEQASALAVAVSVFKTGNDTFQPPRRAATPARTGIAVASPRPQAALGKPAPEGDDWEEF